MSLFIGTIFYWVLNLHGLRKLDYKVIEADESLLKEFGSIASSIYKWDFFMLPILLLIIYIGLSLSIAFIGLLIYLLFGDEIFNSLNLSFLKQPLFLNIFSLLIYLLVFTIQYFAHQSEFSFREKYEYVKRSLNSANLPINLAITECAKNIELLVLKVKKVQKKLSEIPNSDYLNEKEKQAFSQQISQSQTLYQNQLNNYASSFFKLHLSQQKQQLGTIINEVFYQNKEVDGNELNVITENINSLLAHDYWQYTDMDKSTYQAMQPILAKLKKVDQRETFAKQVADLAPTKDLLNLDDHELQTQIELADLKNTENLAQQTLTEFTQSTQLLNDELARLQAENEVTDKFG